MAGRRQRFVNFVSRNLERALRVDQADSAAEEEVPEEVLPMTPQQLLDLEREEYFRVHRAVQRLRELVLILPRGVRRHLLQHPVVLEVRELLRGLRVDQIPAELLNLLNDLI